jgi:ankyrin repeat protein
MVDYEAGLTKVISRYENTCQWLLENDQFQTWASGGSTIFWLSGYPGQGKSVLAKFVVQSSTAGEPGSELPLALASRLQKERLLVCYFFCSNDDDRTRSIRHLVGCLIHQMIIQVPDAATPIEKTWRVIDKDITESVESMWAVFFKALSVIQNRTLLLVIDAVDELDKKWWTVFLEEVNRAIKAAKAKLLVLITSRREPEITKHLSQWPIKQFSLDNSANTKDDISSFIDGVVSEYAKENSFHGAMAQRVCDTLKSRADGMFLWVKLAWNNFIDGVGFWTKATLAKRLIELERLPPGLDALYYRILNNVDHRLHDQLVESLRWIALAKRPLTPHDLSIALALKDRPKQSEDVDRIYSIEQFLRDRCAHVIKIYEGVITVTHASFRNFLFEAKEVQTADKTGTVANQFFLNRPKDDCRVGLDCMTYLLFRDLPAPSDRLRPYHTVFNDKSTTQKFSFLDYTALYWSEHVSPQDDEFIGDIYTAFKKLINSPSNYQAMCAGQKGGAYEVMNRPLFVAFRMGLDKIVQRLVDDGHKINELDHDSNHIIHQTRRSGEIILHTVGTLNIFARILELADINFLLNLGADINGRDSLKQTILIRLVRNLRDEDNDEFDSIEVFHEWLARPGIDVNARDHLGVTALHAAVVLGVKAASAAIAALFKRADLDPNVQDHDGLTPLTRAIHWGKEYAARTLLGHPRVAVDRGEIFGESPLLNAASQYWEDVVRLILARLTSVEQYRDATGKTILHWCVITGMRTCLDMALRKHGTGETQREFVNAADSRGMTALHYAAQDGDLDAALALLDHGARATRKNSFGETTLHLAAQGGHRRVVEALLQHVPVWLLDERDGLGCTVLHRAVVSGNEALVRFLVGGADVDGRKRDRHGRTSLAYAAAYASVGTFKALVEGGGGFVGDACGYTLLHFAMMGHNEPMVDFLLKPVDGETTDGSPQFRDSLRQLQRHFEKNAENHWGKTPFDYAPAASPLATRMAAEGMRHSEMHLVQESRLLFERRDTVESTYGEEMAVTYVTRE